MRQCSIESREIMIMFHRHLANDSSKLHQCLTYVPCLCLKLYSLNFAIVNAQKRLFSLSEFVIKHKKSNLSLESSRIHQICKLVSL